jgi:hypothetical protein
MKWKIEIEKGRAGKNVEGTQEQEWFATDHTPKQPGCPIFV